MHACMTLTTHAASRIRYTPISIRWRFAGSQEDQQHNAAPMMALACCSPSAPCPHNGITTRDTDRRVQGQRQAQ